MAGRDAYRFRMGPSEKREDADITFRNVMDEGTPTDTPVIPPAHSSSPGGIAENIFLSEQGLRSAWRLLIYGALVVGIYFVVSLMLWTFARSPRGTFSYAKQLFFESTGLVSVLGAAFLMSRIERRSPGVYGLPLRSMFGKQFWYGWLFGFCEISALVLTISVFGGYSFGALALHGTDILRWGLLWLGLFLTVGFFEEFLFRGYSLYTLSDGIGFWPASIVLSILFGAVHRQNEGESWVGILGIVIVGLFWCFTVKRTGTLWFAVGMHASFDFGETFLYSVPDSGALFPGHLSNATLQGPAWLTGGSVGPEASLFDFLILFAFFYLFHKMFPANNPKTF